MFNDQNAAGAWKRNRTLMVLGIIGGMSYGLTVWLVVCVNSLAFARSTKLFTTHFINSVMAGFIIYLPFAMGFTAVFWAEMEKRQGIWAWFCLPLIPLAGTLLGMLLVWLVYIVILLPLWIVLSVLGGVAGGLSGRSVHSRRSKNAVGLRERRRIYFAELVRSSVARIPYTGDTGTTRTRRYTKGKLV